MVEALPGVRMMSLAKQMSDHVWSFRFIKNFKHIISLAVFATPTVQPDLGL
jgi:hypothetical protein